MKNRSSFVAFLFTSLMFFFSGCNQDDIPNNFETCKKFNAKPFFDTDNINSLPVANWIYRDSLFDTQGNFERISYDTVRFEKQLQSTADNNIWWKVNSSRPKGICKYAFTTDSTLYALDRPFFGSNLTLKAYEWLQVLTADSVRRGNLLSDMAYIEITKKLKNISVAVPQGTYTDCVETIKYLGNNNDQIIFKPQVGVLKYITYQVTGNPFNIQYNQRRQVSELIYFSN
jgi:hypothetical protein